jgi:hypothetical protein
MIDVSSLLRIRNYPPNFEHTKLDGRKECSGFWREPGNICKRTLSHYSLLSVGKVRHGW